MSVDKLVTTLKKEAALQEKAILEKSQKEAEGILLSAREKVEELDGQIKKIEAELEAKKEYLQEGQKILMERRQSSWLESEQIKAFKSHCKDLYREFIASDVYDNFVEREFRKIQKMFKDVEEVRADAITREVFNRKIKDVKNVFADKTVEDGFLVKTSKGKINIVCNFEGRFEKVWAMQAPKYVLEMRRI